LFTSRHGTFSPLRPRRAVTCNFFLYGFQGGLYLLPFLPCLVGFSHFRKVSFCAGPSFLLWCRDTTAVRFFPSISPCFLIAVVFLTHGSVSPFHLPVFFSPGTSLLFWRQKPFRRFVGPLRVSSAGRRSFRLTLRAFSFLSKTYHRWFFPALPSISSFRGDPPPSAHARSP